MLNADLYECWLKEDDQAAAEEMAARGYDTPAEFGEKTRATYYGDWRTLEQLNYWKAHAAQKVMYKIQLKLGDWLDYIRHIRAKTMNISKNARPSLVKPKDSASYQCTTPYLCCSLKKWQCRSIAT